MALTQTQATALRTRITDLLTAAWPELMAFQAGHLSRRGRYAQLLRTHDFTPVDGAESAPSLNRKPHYQAEDGSALVSELPATIPFTLEVHQYVQPDGTCGWTAYVEVVVNGQTWRRAQDCGVEPGRSHGWVQLEARM